jgi:amino acid transporter
MDNEFVLSVFMKELMGNTAAQIITVLILWVAFASVFSATLGYSRIPYAAASDGAFFKVFARLHPTKGFPYISLLVLGGVAFIFSMLFKLKEVISAILAMRILIQFISQAIGLILLRRQRNASEFPYKMPFFPIPAILAILMWAALFVATGTTMMLSGLTVIAVGTLVYMIKARMNKEWPFKAGL